MIIKLYKKIMLNVLHWLNYNKIENEEGSCHVILNVLDLLLATIYASISIYKLKSVSSIVLILNLITLSRYILDNFKQSSNLRRKYKEKYLKTINLEYKSIYDIKLIIEFTIIAFSLTPYWPQGKLFDEYVIRSFAGTVICLSFVESFIKINTELFEASVEI